MTHNEFVNKVGFVYDKTSANNVVNKVNSTAQQMQNSINGVLNPLKQMAILIGVGLSLRAMNSMVEEFGQVNDALKSAVGEMEDFSSTQKDVLDGANAARMSYASMATNVGNLARVNKTLFPTKDAIEFTSIYSKLLTTAGRSEQTLNGSISMLSRDFGIGVISAGTIQMMLRQTPEVIDLISKKLGKTNAQIIEMASKKQISVETFKNVVMESSQEIDTKFKQTSISINDALRRIRQNWGFWLYQTNESYHITDKLALLAIKLGDFFLRSIDKIKSGFDKFAEYVGGAETAIRLLGTAISVIFVIKNFGTIMTIIKAIGAAITSLTGPVGLVIATLLLLLPVIEDIFVFFKGGDSMFGDKLAKMGVSLDNIKESASDIWNTIKSMFQSSGFIDSFVDSIFEIGGYIEDLIIYTVKLGKAIWDVCGNDVIKGISISISIFKDLLSVVVNVVKLIVSILNGDMKGVADSIGKIFSGLYNIVINVFKSMIATMSVIFKEIAAIVYSLGSIIVTALSDAIKSCVTYIMEKWQSLLDWFASLPSKFLQWGSDMIQNLIDGIKSKVGELVEAVTGVAEKIKSFFHFSLPDEGPLAEADKWMPDFIQLMSQGLIKGAPILENAASVATASVKAGTSMQAIYNNSATNNRSITQNVSFNNQFHGERAVQKNVSKTFNDSANSTTEILARGLQYTVS